MSYCCVATCLLHQSRVYINIQDRAWVHPSGWPCEGMAGAPIHPEDLE